MELRFLLARILMSPFLSRPPPPSTPIVFVEEHVPPCVFLCTQKTLSLDQQLIHTMEVVNKLQWGAWVSAYHCCRTETPYLQNSRERLLRQLIPLRLCLMLENGFQPPTYVAADRCRQFTTAPRCHTNLTLNFFACYSSTHTP